jgi:hypothetical protein
MAGIDARGGGVAGRTGRDTRIQRSLPGRPEPHPPTVERTPALAPPVDPPTPVPFQCMGIGKLERRHTTLGVKVPRPASPIGWAPASLSVVLTA